MDSEPVSWFEGRVKRRAWLALDEVTVLKGYAKGKAKRKTLRARDVIPKGNILKENNFIAFVRLEHRINKNEFMQNLPNVQRLDSSVPIGPVFYPSRKKNAAVRMALTNEIIVRFKAGISASGIENAEKQYRLIRVKRFQFSVNAFLYQTQGVWASLETANTLHRSGLVKYAYPNWYRTRNKRASIPNDPLFGNQWHLRNTGQNGGTSGEDVDIIDVWDTYRGSVNEVIAIVDDGLEIDHEDLSGNIISGKNWDYIDGDDNPTPTAADDHGTACAGVAAAEGFLDEENKKGVAGAAPWAGLVGYRLLEPGILDANEADALTRNNDIVDIYSNSWGPADGGSVLEGPGTLTEDALQNGTTNGRGKLGSIFVWAGGNGYDADNSNYDGYANSRYTIAVAASTNFGTQASYSEKGANILVNAPSNGGSLAITTTDLMGSDGASTGNYRDDFGGTSSATPLVSGIVALMLEANPNLTWRDVQHILMETAEQNDAGNPDWEFNGAGYPVSHKYGFGRINAQAAVNAALNWTSAAPETSAQGSANPDISIPDYPLPGVTDTITITDDINIEFVEVYFTAADHTYWGDLEIALMSPAGTKSILAELHSSGRSYTYNNWRFGTVRHFMESSKGDWTLTVKDLYSEDTGTFQSWEIRIYGTSASGNKSIVPILQLLLLD
ncbi:S8 family serine peptidase [Thermodesulfobacteriota bacterium]